MRAQPPFPYPGRALDASSKAGGGVSFLVLCKLPTSISALVLSPSPLPRPNQLPLPFEGRR